MWSLLGRFVCNRQGATAIEYGLIVALICGGLILGADASGAGVNEIMTTLSVHLATDGK